jgi:hypothetical protein
MAIIRLERAGYLGDRAWLIAARIEFGDELEAGRHHRITGP